MLFRFFNQLGSTGFSPSDIADLKVWLDASDTATITDVSGNVSNWADNTINLEDFIQNTVSNQPSTEVDILNDLNVITFPGSVDKEHLSNSNIRTSLSISSNFTIMIAFKSGTGGGTLLASTISGSDKMSISIIGGPNGIRAGVSDGVTPVSTSVAFTDTASPHVITMTNTSSSVVTSWLDGVLFDGLSGPSISSAAGTTLGSKTSSSDNFGGIMGEVLIYTRVLSTAERTSAEAYLTNKWGI